MTSRAVQRRADWSAAWREHAAALAHVVNHCLERTEDLAEREQLLTRARVELMDRTASAVDDALGWARRQPPRPPLRLVSGMDEAERSSS